MASAIDDTKPIAGTPTTQSVRDNFATAKSEITALQAGVPTWTVGSVPFATSTTALGQDNANLFYDNANDRLGIGTAAPGTRLEVAGTVKVTSTTDAIIQMNSGAGTGGAPKLQGIKNNSPRWELAMGNALAESGSNAGADYSLGRFADNGSYLAEAMHINRNNGACLNASGTWTALSALELKQDVQPYRRGLEAIVALTPVEFRYRAGTPFGEGEAPSRLLFGLIAEDVAPVVPEIIGTTKALIGGKETELQTLEVGNLLYTCINAIKTLKAEIDDLRAQLAAG